MSNFELNFNTTPFTLTNATAGPQGATGNTGATGATGSTGATGATGPVNPGVSVPALSFMQAMKAGKMPHAITVLGDSTGNDDDEWVKLFTGWLCTHFPEYTVETRLWNDTKQGYDAPVLRQTGTAGLRRYISTGASTNRTFVVADSAANSIVGDMTVEFQVKFGGLPGAAFSVCSKRDLGAPNASWRFELNSSGTLTLYWTTDGTTEIIKSSTTAITSGMYNSVYWYRVKLDVDNGASGNDVKFYTSPDYVTWTQLGTTVTTAGVTSIANTTSNVIFNGRGGAQTQLSTMEFWNMRVHNGITDASMFPVVDINTAQYYGASATVLSGSFKGMAIGETVTGFTSSTGSFTGAPVLTVYNGSKPGADFTYLTNATRIPLMSPYVSDLVFISNSHNEATDFVNYPVTYAAYIASVRARMPNASFVLCSQNSEKSPGIAPEQHALRCAMVPSLALANNCGLANVYQAYLNTGVPDSYVNSDGIHPSTSGGFNGSQLWADTVTALFTPYL